MDSRSSRPLPPWAWPVLLVTFLHLLTTSGAWWITDHGEILLAADHFVATGRLDLNDLGPQWADWTQIVKARDNASTRFQPLSILLLTPFLVLDRIFGWGDPASFRFVHLQGHVFVTLGLVLAGRGLARLTGSAPITALSILLLGLNWPVWMIARRLGPEPVLFALLAAFATGGARSRFSCQLLLPWVHASGPLLGLGALLALAVEQRSVTSRAVRGAALGWVSGLASVAFLWNLPVHGHLVLGGYGDYASDPFFTLRNPLLGLVAVLGPVVAWTLPLWYLAVRTGPGGRLQTLALWFPMAAFLAAFSNPEPERRLAPLLAAWTIAVMIRAAPTKLAQPSSIPLTSGRALALSALSLASGVIGLSSDFVDTVTTPLGVFSGPVLMFVRLAFVQAEPGLAAASVLLLGSAIVYAGSRTLALILHPPPAQLGETGSVAQNPGS